MQQKKFITNIAFLIILNLLIKPFWPLGIEPLVQNTVGNAMYGEYFILFNFSFLLNIILDFGITNFNNKNIAQNNHLLSKHFSSLFTLKLILGFFYLIITIVLGIAMGYETRFIKLLFLLSINQFLISMIAYLRSNLLGLHLFKTDSFISIADRVIMIVLCIMLALKCFGLELNIMTFVYTQNIGYFLTAFIAFVTVYSKTNHFKLVWNFPFSVMILKQSMPYAILVLLMTFYNRVDAVMLEKLLPENNIYLSTLINKIKSIPELMQNEKISQIIASSSELLKESGTYQAGIYAKAFRLLDAGNMIAYLFSVQLLPTFSTMIKYKENVEHIVKLSFIILVAPALLVSIGCYSYSNEISYLINHGVNDSAKEFGLLMFCFTFISSTYIFGTLLTANGSLKQLNSMAIIGIFINIGLNFFLIPKLQAIGSVYSSVITQFFTAAIQIYFSIKIFKLKFNYKLITSLLLYIIGLVIINYYSKIMTDNWLLNFFIMVICSLILLFATKLISIKSILNLKSIKT